MLGNGRLEAQCFDGENRLAHIRGKMRKKVWINQGDIILVSLRVPLGTNDATQASVFPARRSSPNDVVCLMLTSGSTGNSKAVALRHSNLLSSVLGKINRHNTTSSSRFLNCIAFDHVACVSEVHLQALEAVASQYHVAPSAIIRRLHNLLDWYSNLHIMYFSVRTSSLLRYVVTRPLRRIPSDR